MKKLTSGIIIGLIATNLLITGCNINPFLETESIEVPVLPDSLEGVNSRSNLSNRAVHNPQTLSESNVYGSFYLIPQLAHNYNLWVDDNVTPFLEGAKNGTLANGEEWVEISQEPYRYTLTETEYAYDPVIRVNEDFSEYDIYWSYANGETRYLKVTETESYKRATLIVHNPGGDESSIDTAEIVETSDNIYSKVVRLYNIQTSPDLHHFLSITDKTSVDGKTTGRYMSIEGQLDFTFPRAAGGDSGSDYWDQELYPDIPEAQNVYEVYGFFNDIDLCKSVASVNWSTDGYPDPAILTDLFTEGLTTEFIGSIEFGDTAATITPEIPAWDENLIE